MLTSLVCSYSFIYFVWLFLVMFCSRRLTSLTYLLLDQGTELWFLLCKKINIWKFKNTKTKMCILLAVLISYQSYPHNSCSPPIFLANSVYIYALYQLSFLNFQPSNWAFLFSTFQHNKLIHMFVYAECM